MRQVSLLIKYRKMIGQGSARGRRQMTLRHEIALIDRYPKLYRLARRPCRPPVHAFALDGFSCGDGWFEIIDRLSAKFSAFPDLLVVQVKEKFGKLRFYAESDREDGSCRPGDLQAELDLATEQSASTCELCGQPGVLAERRGRWLSVRCRACECLDRMEEACQSLQRRVTELGSVLLDPLLLDSMRLSLLKLGHGPRLLPTDRRSLFSRASWRRLMAIEELDDVLKMSPDKIATFVRKAVPSLVKALH